MKKIKPNKAQWRKMYFLATIECLITFYKVPKLEAKKLVMNYAKRLKTGGLFKSDLFLHAEVINTAGDLIDMEVPEIYSIDQDKYKQIHNEAYDKAIKNEPSLMYQSYKKKG